jgi:hypothetical protein
MNRKVLLIFFISLILFCFEKQRIAIFSVQGINVDEGVSTALLMSLSSELTNSKRITNIERAEIEKILKEQAIQLSGCTSIECQVEVGRMLGAEKVILGIISKVEGLYLISVKVVDVTLGSIESEIGPVKAKSVDEFMIVSREIVRKIENNIPVIPEIVGFLGEQPVIDVGRNLGIQIGDVFTVTRIKDVVKDKEGKVIFKNEEVIGKIKVVSVQEEGAVCEIISKLKDIVKGDYARKGEYVGIDRTKVDIEPPLIEHTPIKFARSDKPVKIIAKITDKSGIKEVNIGIKTEEGEQYKLWMKKEKGDIYTLLLPKDYLKYKKIYYEINAIDMNGNSSISNDNGNYYEINIKKGKGSKKPFFITQAHLR